MKRHKIGRVSPLSGYFVGMEFCEVCGAMRDWENRGQWLLEGEKQPYCKGMEVNHDTRN